MRSNAYTITFTSLITIVLGFFLSLASTALKERQELNMENDIKKNILRSLGFAPSVETPWTSDSVQDIFEKYIQGFVVNEKGETVDGKKPEDLNPETDFNHFPVYMKKMAGTIEGYAIPISGKGLWSTLYGYFAVEPDGKTVKGLTFYKHGETPGLGGEVEKTWFTDNFKGKQFVDNDGNLVGIQILKGQVDASMPSAFHQVDGISGATMTTKGVNVFLMEELKKYEPFFKNIRTEGGA